MGYVKISMLEALESLATSYTMDEGRYDFNSYDKSSYDAFISLPEQPSDFRLINKSRYLSLNAS